MLFATRICLCAVAFLHRHEAGQESGFVQIASNPRIFYSNDFFANLTAKKVNKLFDAAAQTVGVQSSSVGEGSAEMTRRSKSMFLSSGFIRQHPWNETLETMRTKLAHELKLSASHFETLQLVNYVGGAKEPGFYGPHTDGLGRYATLVVFMSEHGEECGGELVFPFVDSKGHAKSGSFDLKPGATTGDVAKPWRVKNWPAMLCSAHGSDLDILRFKPKLGAAILFFHHPLHAGKVKGDSDPYAMHGACPLLRASCGVRRIAQQWVTYEWVSPREDESCEISLPKVMEKDTSARKLPTNWQKEKLTPSLCKKDDHSRQSNTLEISTSSKPENKHQQLNCISLASGMASRFRGRRGLTFAFALPCMWGSPYESEGVLELHVGEEFRVRVDAKGNFEKGGCKVSASINQGNATAVNKPMSLVTAADKLWNRVAIVVRPDETDSLKATLVLDSQTGIKRKSMKLPNSASVGVKKSSSLLDRSLISATNAATDAYLCTNSRLSDKTMFHYINLWSRDFNKYEEGQLWQWLDIQTPGPAKANM